MKVWGEEERTGPDSVLSIRAGSRPKVPAS